MTELAAITPDVRSAARRIYFQDNLSDFFTRQLKIRTKGIGIAPFIPNDFQQEILTGIKQQMREIGKVRQIWYKCRQPGGSTLASGIIWGKTVLNSGVNSFIVAQDKTTVAKIFGMHDLFYKSMTPDIRPPRQYFTKGTQIVLGDYEGTGITSELLVGEAKNMNLGVGSTIHCLHLSEVTRYQSQAALTESLLPACSDYPGTVRIMESTAHFGQCADYFRDQCYRSMAGQSDYQYHFIKWWKLPEYSAPLLPGERLKLDSHSEYPGEKILVKKLGLTFENIKWRRSKIDEYRGDVDMFKLSYPMDFEEGWITKEAQAFPYGRLRDMQTELRPPIARFDCFEGRLVPNDEQGLLYVWKKPQVGVLYDIGGDVAGGDGAPTDGVEGSRAGDFSVAEVIQRGTLEQVAEWRGHILPREFGDVLAAIGRYYNDAQIASEVNTFGLSTVGRLREVYANLYLWRKRDKIEIKYTGEFGWITSYQSKNLIVNLMKEKLYYRQVVIHSKVLWDEMRNFVREFTPTGMVTYAAATGYDDCVMAFMIAVQTSEDENWERYHQDSVKTVEAPQEPQIIDSARQDTTWSEVLREYDTNAGDEFQVDLAAWK